MDPDIAAAVLALRVRRPTWGPRELLVRSRMDEPDKAWPAASTAGDLPRRNKLSIPGRHKPDEPRAVTGLIEASAPNESWSAGAAGPLPGGSG
jgi:putative transposase